MTTIFEDNADHLKWTTGYFAEDFGRNKHVDIRYHQVGEQMNVVVVCLEKIYARNMVADFLTKSLSAVGIDEADKKSWSVCSGC